MRRGALASFLHTHRDRQIHELGMKRSLKSLEICKDDWFESRHVFILLFFFADMVWI